LTGEPPITNSEFWIFHDPNHYAEHKEKAVKRFVEKVVESICQKQPLECIGYYLPAINFVELLLFLSKQEIIEKSVDFNSFEQSVYFNNATFYEGASFSVITFKRIAYFVGATFFQRANFAGATFTELAFFNGATFTGEEANFAGATFLKKRSFWKLNSVKDVQSLV
jgi:hypothetical protein